MNKPKGNVEAFLGTDRNNPRPEPNRPVKPRQKKYVDNPIMAVDRKQVLLESGEIYPLDQLPHLIQTQPSSILVSNHVGAMVKFLDGRFDDNSRWQYRAAPIERAAWAPNRKRKATIKDCVVGYLGFMGENKKKGHYHYPLDPHHFVLKSIGELRKNIPGENSTLIKLMEWAKEVRTFLQSQELRLSPTAGGIAAQLLKDERFYPKARRKVPHKINRKGREQLPGNFYELYAAKDDGTYYRAAYLDQSNAHHTHAKELNFPCANTLRARGRYETLQDRSYAKAGTTKFDQLISHYGLFYLAVEVPRFSSIDFPLPQINLGKHGYQKAFFHSNELPYLRELGVRVRHIIACWTSPDSDPGLNRYAEWALKEIAKSPNNSRPWLKPTLLSTYGVLAAKPKHLEFGYKQAKNSEPKQYPCGVGFLDVQAKRTKKEKEPLMANVIHRGMIEAETRLSSLRLARELSRQGHTVLAIYADSVFVEDGKPLPLLPPPWRIQDFLTGLQFESATHFSSHQITKQPGISANWRDFPHRVPARPRRKKSDTKN